MKKIFLKLNDVVAGYWIVEGAGTRNFELYNLHLALDPIEDGLVQVTKHNGTVFIWSLDSFKEPAKIECRTAQDQNAFDTLYNKYYDKRWKEMPQIEMSDENYDALQKKWDIIQKQHLKYVIFTLDDSGALDLVDLIGKNELSGEDLADMKNEHDKFLQYETARRLYRHSLADYSDVWRSPADDEYEVDIEKHYDKKSGGWVDAIKRKIGL